MKGELNNNSVRAVSIQQDEDEVNARLLAEDRHERTGSVKFADQADEGKEASPSQSIPIVTLSTPF